MALAGSIPTPSPLAPAIVHLTVTSTAQPITATRPVDWVSFEILNNDASASIWVGPSGVTASGTTGREVEAGMTMEVNASSPDLWYLVSAGSISVTVTGRKVAS